MKKSFSLLILIFLLSIFSYLTITILQTKSIRDENLKKQYLYIQAKNHMDFFKKYLQTKNLINIQKIKLEDDVFNIYADIKENKIDIFVKAKVHNISIHESLIK